MRRRSGGEKASTGGGALALFHPLVRKWFTDTLGEPTDVQAEAWPVIAGGGHVLVTAPTGSGKTLTAFLWALNQLITGQWATGAARVLYVSPLKALNNDIQRNLLGPLRELGRAFAAAGERFPDIRVQTRSGDTPGSERRRMVHHPPEILITTPESLNLLLSSPTGRGILSGIQSVILDEIHAVAPNKRGTHLITAVERLALLAGEFQRIALSATIKPLETVAEFAGGYTMEGESSNPVYRKRRVQIIQSGMAKKIELTVKFPADARDAIEDGSWWPPLIRAFRAEILNHKSSLLFANNRRHTEKVARLLNEDEEEMIAYAHHGSLSRDVRAVVEQRMKEGTLPAIVATSSLELGIDIGALDRVLLIETPPTVASALQRVGRAGHSVGEVSRAVLFPTHGTDFLAAAVMARAVAERDIESVSPPQRPLDILAQVIVSMTGVEKWNLDDLFAFIKTCYPYRELTRRQFDLVIDMLAGRYQESRLRELQPRVAVDRIENTIQARQGSLQLLYSSGGAIPDRGYFTLRVQGSGARIGELDEEFVWERSIGDTFTLGTQTWRIQRIGNHEVEVLPSEGPGALAPFWKAEARDRDTRFAERIAGFLEDHNSRVDEDSFQDTLCREYFMDEAAARELVGLLRRQKSATATDLPHRHHLIVEETPGLVQSTETRQVVLHTLWGGRANRPFAMALSAAWEEKHHYPLETMSDDDCIVLMLPAEADAANLWTLVRPDNLESLLRKKLEQTGFFGARFRENAARALLLPKPGFGKRMPLWLTRLRSRQLLGTVAHYEDFPILAETWRTCLQDEFDLPALKTRLDEIRSGEIRVSHVTTLVPSPFTRNLAWQQTNYYMYTDDTPAASLKSGLREDVVRELVHSPEMRPRINAQTIEHFRRRVQRTAPGYAPRDAGELLEWIKERNVIPMPEWRELLEAAAGDSGMGPEELLISLESRIVQIRLPGSASDSIAAIEQLPRLAAALGYERGDLGAVPLDGERGSVSDASQGAIDTAFTLAGASSNADGTDPAAGLLGEWLRYQGPIGSSCISGVFGLDPARLEGILDALQSSQSVVIDHLTRGAVEPEICDAENLEILLRLMRSQAMPSFAALPVEQLPCFLASHQSLTSPAALEGSLSEVMEKLFGYPAPVEAWEEDILPARCSGYDSAWLDSLLKQHDVTWFGCGRERISFCPRGDLELYLESSSEAENEPSRSSAHALFPDPRGRYALMDLADYTGRNTGELTRELWDLAWEGRVSNDSFTDVRKGIENRFQPMETTLRRRRSPAGFKQWKSTRPMAGNWHVLPLPDPPEDALEGEEIVKDRVRQLLDRYGILFREILDRELEPLRWGRIFRTLRIMELSGEVLAGRFFEGVPGLQFASHAAFRALKSGWDEDAVYWMSAADPASLCGIRLEGMPELPRRVAATQLVYHGSKLAMVSRRKGGDITINVVPEDASIPRYLELFRVLLRRSFNPPRNIQVETINDVPALDSPYRDVLLSFGFVKDYMKLTLRVYA